MCGYGDKIRRKMGVKWESLTSAKGFWDSLAGGIGRLYYTTPQKQSKTPESLDFKGFSGVFAS